MPPACLPACAFNTIPLSLGGSLSGSGGARWRLGRNLAGCSSMTPNGLQPPASLNCCVSLNSVAHATELIDSAIGRRRKPCHSSNMVPQVTAPWRQLFVAWGREGEWQSRAAWLRRWPNVEGIWESWREGGGAANIASIIPGIACYSIATCIPGIYR